MEAELNRYLNVERLQQASDPLTYWKNIGKQLFPNLADVKIFVYSEFIKKMLLIIFLMCCIKIIKKMC